MAEKALSSKDVRTGTQTEQETGGRADSEAMNECYLLACSR